SYRLEATARVGGAPSEGSQAARPVPSIAATPRPGGPGRYRGDLHSHTVHSDGTITVADRVHGAVEKGMDFLAITDHNTISHYRELGGWPDSITPIRAS